MRVAVDDDEGLCPEGLGSADVKIPMNAVTQVVETLLRTDARKATKYLSETDVVKASRRVFRRGRQRGAQIAIVLTIGRPNYEEREFIRKCRKAGEPFPVRRIRSYILDKRSRTPDPRGQA